jgi:predicted class III extradiol MEMO1 family dioxygenase
VDRACFKRVEMIRRPAVAGRFYPANPTTLRRALAQLLSPFGAEKDRIQARGAVVPHAGYLYSGKTAGKVYRQPHIPPTVVLMGPKPCWLGRCDPHLSMCGVLPAAVMLVAATQLGAKEARLIDYTTSAEATGHAEAMLGYAGLIVC